MALSRRDLLMGVGSLAVLSGIGGLSNVLTSNGSLLRPPGGQDESQLTGLCVKCDRCRSSCPTNCITVAHLEDGLLEARTPKIDFHEGLCDFCNRCIEVCPTGALKSFDPETEKIGIAVVMQDYCIAWKNPNTCIKCIEPCVYDAISFENGVPLVNIDNCNGCGACEYVCPAHVNRSVTGDMARGTRGIMVLSNSEFEKFGQEE